MCSKCLAEEIEDLKTKVKKEAERADIWTNLWGLSGNTIRELQATLDNAKADLFVVRYDLADTTKTLDKYRDMHVKMSRANSDLRKSAADLNETLAMITEERDLSRELFQGMVSAYADLLDRYAKMCDDYDGLVSRYDDLLLRCDFEHDED